MTVNSFARIASISCLIISSLLLVSCNSKDFDNNVSQLPSTAVAQAKSSSWWVKRHQDILKADKSEIKVIFLGDSITQNWENATFGFSIWQQYYGENYAFNMGYSSDKTQNLLWRIKNGEIDNVSPEVIILLIGTNNAAEDSAEDIATGIRTIVEVIINKLPDCKLIVHKIFPRGQANDPLRVVTNQASEIIKNTIKYENVTFLDINALFLDGQENVPLDIMPDLLHPSTKAYQIWADALSTYMPVKG